VGERVDRELDREDDGEKHVDRLEVTPPLRQIPVCINQRFGDLGFRCVEKEVLRRGKLRRFQQGTEFISKRLFPCILKFATYQSNENGRKCLESQ
jgi:hypothetical protein